MLAVVVVAATTIFDLADADDDERYQMILLRANGHADTVIVSVHVWSNVRGELLKLVSTEVDAPWQKSIHVRGKENVTSVLNVRNEALRTERGWTSCQIIVNRDEESAERKRVERTDSDRVMHCLCKHTLFS